MSGQANLFDDERKPKPLRFDGPAYSTELDRERLTDQHNRIKYYCLDRGWVTLGQIAQDLGYPEASISAQLRHLRKERFGSYRVEKRRVGESGLWQYRVRIGGD